ncbi:MAG: hypothetical protein ABR910_01105 [Acidobacteriaceae bacterium]
MSKRAKVARIGLGFLVVGLAGTTAGGMLTGCGVAPEAAKINCTLTQGVLPATATADHTAASPGDRQAFDVGYVLATPGCALPTAILSPQAFVWVSSDPINAPISNAAAAAGIATCVGATTATISTNPVNSIATATLTCK